MADANDGRTYVMRPGDTVLRLVLRFGLEKAEDLVDHPNNEKIREDLVNGFCPPGEKLFVPKPKAPTLQVNPEQQHDFSVRVPKHVVRIEFADAHGPLKNEPYEIDGVGPEKITGTLAGPLLELEIPVSVEQIHLVFTKRHVAHTIWVGHLAPLRHEAGSDARLAHLGYRPVGAFDDDPHHFLDREERARVVSGFQAAFGLNETGFADQLTQDKLREKHGC